MPEGWFHGEVGSSTGGPPTFDAATTATTSGTSFQNAITWSHTVGSGANRLLVVCVGALSGGLPSSATVNTVSMTFLGRVFETGGGVYVDIFYRLAPPSGTDTIVYTTGSGTHMAAVAISYSNVDQTTPFGTQGSASSAGATSDTTTISATVNDVVLSAMFVFDNSGPPAVTAGAGQTTRGDILTASQIRTVATEQAGAASVTSSFSWSVSDPTGQLSVPIHGASPSVFEGWS